MMDFFANLFMCKPGRQFGIHGTVLTNCGGMEDAELCLRCGLEYYPTIMRGMIAQEKREIKVPEDWPAIEAARKLPGGIDCD
jgi:hypothetical protein